MDEITNQLTNLDLNDNREYKHLYKKSQNIITNLQKEIYKLKIKLYNIQQQNVKNIIKLFIVKYNECKNSYIETSHKMNIFYHDIYNFYLIKERVKNDAVNKKREIIIYCIVNNLIPNDWYKINLYWYSLKINLNKFIFKYKPEKYSSLNIDYKAGRHNNFDFILNFTINKEVIKKIKIEFKYNCKEIQNYPQFLSISADNFIKNNSISYAEYFYDNYVQQLADIYNLTMPTREEYLNNLYNCIHKIDFTNELYKLRTDKQLCQLKQKLVKKSIEEYLNLVKIDINSVNKKLQETQFDKYFMFYKDGLFYHDKFVNDELKIKNIEEIKNKNTIVFNTHNKKTKILFLLRWKNNCGILFPAWQISIRREK